MNANELMIGDFVRVNRDGLCIKKDTIVEIRSIDTDNNFPEKGLFGCASCRPLDGNQFNGGVWLDYLEPIPLTSEILERNFVKKTFFGLYDDNYDLTIREYCDGMYVVNYHSCDMAIPDEQVVVSYVHQLQHFLRHCGIDKDIVL